MKLEIGGKRYDMCDENTCNMLHMMELQQQARDILPGGSGMNALRKLRQEGIEYRRKLIRYNAEQAAGQNPEEPDIPDGMLAMTAVIVFLSRRAAGDNVTFREAANLPFGEVKYIREDGDQDPLRDDGDDAEDPPVPGDGPGTIGDVGGHGEPGTGTSPSMTSPKASTDGSGTSPGDGRGSRPGNSVGSRHGGGYTSSRSPTRKSGKGKKRKRV